MGGWIDLLGLWSKWVGGVGGGVGERTMGVCSGHSARRGPVYFCCPPPPPPPVRATSPPPSLEEEGKGGGGPGVVEEGGPKAVFIMPFMTHLGGREWVGGWVDGLCQGQD